MSSANLSRLAGKVQDALRVEARKSRYRHDPVAWVEGFLGQRVWSKQKEILYSIRDNRNTAVAAGHGVGKSKIAALAMAWWVDVHPPHETFVASTAPFADQISAILWNELKKIHQSAKERHAEYKRRLAAGEPLGEFAECDHELYGYITGDNKWKSPMGVLIGQGRKPPDNKADSGYQGLHARYLFAVGDEAAGLNQDMINALGNITTGADNRQLLICNPTDPTSAMAQIWAKELQDWVRMNISVLDSPLITHEPGWEYFQSVGMSGQEYVDGMRERWGEDNPEYRIRVLGEWAFERGNNVFSDVAIAMAANACVQPDTENIYIQLGVDVARGNTDATELYVARRGWVWRVDPETNKPVEPTTRQGWHLRHLDSWKGKPLTWTDPEKPGTAELVDRYGRSEGVSVIAVDAAGMGVAVTDRITELMRGSRYQLVEVWGSKPSNDTRAFVNIRAQALFDLAEAFQRGEVDIDPGDEEFITQLRSVVFEYTDRGQKKIESKDSMKRRGLKSPDKVDAAWYACTDFARMIEDPLSGLKSGDRVGYDPDTILDPEFAGVGALEPW